MTYYDYIAWANEYRSQADVICRILSEKKAGLRFISPQERSSEERRVQLLRVMKRECLRSMAELENIAKHIKESERIETI